MFCEACVRLATSYQSSRPKSTARRSQTLIAGTYKDSRDCTLSVTFWGRGMRASLVGARYSVQFKARAFTVFIEALRLCMVAKAQQASSSIVALVLVQECYARFCKQSSRECIVCARQQIQSTAVTRKTGRRALHTYLFLFKNKVRVPNILRASATRNSCLSAGARNHFDLTR
jgi:hypothetical protein